MKASSWSEIRSANISYAHSLSSFTTNLNEYRTPVQIIILIFVISCRKTNNCANKCPERKYQHSFSEFQLFIQCPPKQDQCIDCEIEIWNAYRGHPSFIFYLHSGRPATAKTANRIIAFVYQCIVHPPACMNACIHNHINWFANAYSGKLFHRDTRTTAILTFANDIFFLLNAPIKINIIQLWNKRTGNHWQFNAFSLPILLAPHAHRPLHLRHCIRADEEDSVTHFLFRPIGNE